MTKKITIFFATIAISSSLLATETKKASAEVGWRFGNFQDINKTKSPKTQKEILKKMLSVQEEQLKTQKEILDILQKRFDPKPETIIVNGKPCIANSSDKCYKWIPEPEAKRYPVIANFFSHPTKEGALKYLRWYSKHMNHAKKAGIELMLAKYQFGEKSLDFNSKKNGMIGSFGEISHAKKEHKVKIIQKYLKDFYLNVYLGRGLDVDIFGIKSITNIADDIPGININIVFYSEDVKNKLYAISKYYPYLKEFLHNTKNQYVSKNLFKKHGIYSTPTVEVVLNKDKSHQILGTGSVSGTAVLDNLTRYFWVKKIIKSNTYDNDYKTWDDSKYLKDTMYEKTRTLYDLKKYEYKNTDMKAKTPFDVKKWR